jgi:hypothetical protein
MTPLAQACLISLPWAVRAQIASTSIAITMSGHSESAGMKKKVSGRFMAVVTQNA